MQITLGRKLFLYTSALLLTVVLIAFVVLERNQARQWREYLQVQQLAFARFATPELLKHFRGNFREASGPAHREQLKGLLAFNPDLLKFTIYSPTGRNLFDPPPLHQVSLPNAPLQKEQLLDLLEPWAKPHSLIDGSQVLEVVAPAFGPSGQKVLYVQYFFSYASVATNLQDMRKTYALIALIAIGCSLVLVALVAKRFTLPIHRLTEGVRAVSGGQLKTRIETQGTDELAVLAEAFNEMSANLAANQEELKLMQERMLRSECLAAVGQVAAGVSHEIDNPVGIILGYAELMLEDLSADDPRAEDLQAIVDECHRCKKITGGLLGLARNSEPRREPVDLKALMIETIKSLRPQKLFRRIDIQVEGDVSPTDVWADSDRIRQVFMNLLLNAAQALSGEGNIRVELAEADSQIHIKVHDNGPGFSDIDLDKVFEPFFTTKGGGEGTGLGLSICEKLIEEHSGTISADRSPDGGALMIVSLPVRSR